MKLCGLKDFSMTEEKQLTESQQVESGAAEATASPAFVDDEAWKVLKKIIP